MVGHRQRGITRLAMWASMFVLEVGAFQFEVWSVRGSGLSVSRCMPNVCNLGFVVWA